jgi:hypothetical protein
LVTTDHAPDVSRSESPIPIVLVESLTSLARSLALRAFATAQARVQGSTAQLGRLDGARAIRPSFSGIPTTSRTRTSRAVRGRLAVPWRLTGT